MIPLMKSAFSHEREVREAMAQFVLSGNRLSMGQVCEAFEREFSEWQGRRYSVFVSSGSAANLSLVQALLNLGRIKRGDSVGFSALTWATNVMPLIQLGLEPVPVDVEIESLNVSQHQLYDAGPMRAMFLTNALGLCDKIETIAMMCEDSGTILLEDNCESLGSEHYKEKLGNFGLASTFSFYIGHHLSTIEGGMVCTDDEELADELRMVRAHGWDRQLEPQKRGKSFWAPYQFRNLAYNLRPTELQAVAGRTGLPFLHEAIDKRERNFREWASMLGSKTYPIKTHTSRTSSFAMPLVFRNEGRFHDGVKAFREAGIEIRPIIAGDITAQPFYIRHKCRQRDTRNAELIGRQGFYFGNCPEYDESELETIRRTLEEVA